MSREQRTVRLGLLGFGTIGSSVYRLIVTEHDRILEGTGVDLRVEKVLEIDQTKIPADAPSGLFTTDFADIVDDSSIDIVVELIGGTDAAFTFLDAGLRKGKNVVTANKQLLASRGEALFSLARDERRHLRFEASVAGAIPIIKVMRESMIAAGLHTVYGIVNGTTNYILSRMYNDEGDYAEILAKAQELGFAEADPTADVGGADAAAKMAILGSIAFHSRVTLADVSFEGIESIGLEDVRYAKDLGFVVKLIGAARLIDERVSVRVFPALVPIDHPLAAISGSHNAVFLQGSAIGEIMLMGPWGRGRTDGHRGGERYHLHRQHQGRWLPAELLMLPPLGILSCGRSGIGLLHQDERGGRGGRAGSDRRRVRRARGLDREHDPERQRGGGGVGAHHSPHTREGFLRGH